MYVQCMQTRKRATQTQKASHAKPTKKMRTEQPEIDVSQSIGREEEISSDKVTIMLCIIMYSSFPGFSLKCMGALTIVSMHLLKASLCYRLN